jgi:hypothetical protein
VRKDAHVALSLVPVAAASNLQLIVGVLGVVVVAIGLINALISNRTATIGWRREMAIPAAGDWAAAPPVMLPARAHFVNREAEIEEAIKRVKGGEAVLAFEGVAGIGKSAAAVELAHRLQVDTTMGFDKCSFVWIDGRDGCPNLTDICRPLSLLTGDQALSIVPDGEKLDALRTHLATNRAVLVLDNLTLADDACSSALRDVVRGMPAGSTVIASVNRPGTLGGSRLPLRELDLDHVEELIEYEARRVGLDTDRDLDADFARRLRAVVGGNPALIQWFLNGWPLSSQSLEQRLDAVERGAGLEKLFGPVWEEQPDATRAVLAACAYLRGQAIEEQLVIACERPQQEVSTALDELIAAGLIVAVRVSRRPNQYACPEGFRRFVLAETEESHLAQVTARLAAHYIRRFGEQWEDAPGAIPHMGAVQVVLEELFAMGDHRNLRVLIAATLDIYFTLGLFDDRIAAGSLAYQSALRAGDHRAASLASAMVANTHAIRGELDEAREAHALGLVAAELSGEPGEVARQRRCGGFLAYRSGDPVRALESIDGAERLARTARDLNNVVDILGLETAAHLYMGSVADAANAAEACLRVCEEIGWKRGIAYPLRDLAEIAIHHGDSDKAKVLLDQARAASVEYADRRQLARVYLTDARMGLFAGDLSAARAAAREAEAQAAALGMPPEAEEARAVGRVATRARWLLPLRVYYRWRRPIRLTDAPVGGD